MRRITRWAWATLASLQAGVILAAPIPPATFVYDVLSGGSLATGCTGGPSATGGSCARAGSGLALTSGGIGTPSYTPIAPGGIVLGTGTAVDAMSQGSKASGAISIASMTYSFEATGPSTVHFIPVDVFSTGILDALGKSDSLLSLVVLDAGTDANIPAGVSDPDPNRPLLDLSAFCHDGRCWSDWGGKELTDLVCVVNGDNYEITITAATSAHGGSDGNSASAYLDPVIALDPPYPTSCPVSVGLDQLGLDTGPGASTGVAVPEPGTLALGLSALGAFALGRRRLRR